jgi:endoglucanase
MRAFLIVIFLGISAWALAAASPAVRIDQVGYQPSETQYAFFSSTAAGLTTSAAGLPWTLVDASNNVLDSGVLSAPVVDNGTSGNAGGTGDTISTIKLNNAYAGGPGQVFIKVQAGSTTFTSYPFVINAGVYTNAYKTVMQGFYGARCGTAVSINTTYGTFSHAACHTAATSGIFYDASAGPALAGKVASAMQGWHDAGDYGRYTVNTAFTLAFFFWTWDLYGNQVGCMNLGLPQGDNPVGTPDLLKESRWALEWMLTMQDPSDGGVFHKSTTANFDSLSELPENDSAGPVLVIGLGNTAGTCPDPPYKTTAATADFAAVMASAARVYKPFDPVFSAKCLAAAQSAFGWITGTAGGTTAIASANPCNISTGSYTDSTVTDEILWASAELFRTTGGAGYNTYFVNNYSPFVPTNSNVPSWNQMSDLACFAYYFANQPSINTTVQAAIKTHTISAASTIAGKPGAFGSSTSINYMHSLSYYDYYWGSTAKASAYAFVLLVANAMQPSASYTQHAWENLHWLMGRNVFSTTMVTQVGSVCPMSLQHRPSITYQQSGLCDGYPWPGLVTGGPNQTDSNLTGQGIAPGAMWQDLYTDYQCNEPAINQMGPAMLLLASTLPSGGACNYTPTFTNSPTPSVTASPTASPNWTFTPTATITMTPTASPTFSVSPTYSVSPTNSPTATVTSTPTQTPTSTISPTPSATRTITDRSIPDILKALAVPNPSLSGKDISFHIHLDGSADHVTAHIYTASYVQAATLSWVGSFRPACWSALPVSGHVFNLSRGLYFVRIQASHNGVNGRSIIFKWYYLD